jgi:hypothetical protein
VKVVDSTFPAILHETSKRGQLGGLHPDSFILGYVFRLNFLIVENLVVSVQMLIIILHPGVFLGIESTYKK